MSALGSTKSKSHRKTHSVESGGTGRKFMRLTWGGPGLREAGESAEAVVVKKTPERAE
jgi:hypothetical protein